MYQNQWDPDGHEKTIKVLAESMKKSSFRARTGFKAEIDREVSEARTNRVIADYSPYLISRLPEGSHIHLTGGQWGKAAEFNLDLAEKVLTGALRFIGL